MRLRARSEAFGHHKTLRRLVGVVDLLVVLSDSAIESLLEVVIIHVHVQSYTWLHCQLYCTRVVLKGGTRKWEIRNEEIGNELERG